MLGFTSLYPAYRVNSAISGSLGAVDSTDFDPTSAFALKGCIYPPKPAHPSLEKFGKRYSRL
ncbi:MAG: hypothetical protein JKY01_14260 [Pseudomonadales bacterium]|nr:hypothetical protein [Pseudomonadales bacterium]